MLIFNDDSDAGWMIISLMTLGNYLLGASHNKVMVMALLLVEGE